MFLATESISASTRYREQKAPIVRGQHRVNVGAASFEWSEQPALSSRRGVEVRKL